MYACVDCVWLWVTNEGVLLACCWWMRALRSLLPFVAACVSSMYVCVCVCGCLCEQYVCVCLWLPV